MSPIPYTSPATVVTATTITSAWGNSVKAATDYLANPPSCRVYRTTLQTLTTATDTVILLDAERYDTDNMHSTVSNTGRITFNTAGIYVVAAHLAYTGNATGVRVLTIRLNGATSLASYIGPPSAGGVDTCLSVSTVYKFAAADYIEMIGHQTSGANLDTRVALQNSQEFAATWIGTG